MNRRQEKQRTWVIASVFLFINTLPAISYPWTGKVVAVTDGDTIKVMHLGKAEKIRLYGIDCPEKAQAYGKKAKKFTSKMVFGKNVEVETITKDRYKRPVVFVRVNGISLNEELIREGFAWVYTRYCNRPICEEWKRLQEKAQTCMGSGLAK
jgi:endonuclease YncB( thermonuclease family)